MKDKICRFETGFKLHKIIIYDTDDAVHYANVQKPDPIHYKAEGLPEVVNGEQN